MSSGFARVVSLPSNRVSPKMGVHHLYTHQTDLLSLSKTFHKNHHICLYPSWYKIKILFVDFLAVYVACFISKTKDAWVELCALYGTGLSLIPKNIMETSLIFSGKICFKIWQENIGFSCIVRIWCYNMLFRW